jgi:hypothetical protein
MRKVPILATYALLLVLGVLQAMIGSFQYSRGPAPLAAIGFSLLLAATCLLAAWAMRSTLAALIPALGWILAAYVLSLPTPGGSVVITNTTAGKWYLYGGTLCAAIAVSIAFRLWLASSRKQSARRSRQPPTAS